MMGKKKEKKSFTGYVDAEVSEFLNYKDSTARRHWIWICFNVIPYCHIWRNGEFKKDRKERMPIRVRIRIFSKSMKKINILKYFKTGVANWNVGSLLKLTGRNYYITAEKLDSESTYTTANGPTYTYTLRLYANDIENNEALKYLLKTKEEKELDKP